MVLTYGTGEAVPHPGVYAVIHGKPHTAYKELFIDLVRFPRCRVCATDVSFRLIRAVENISDDADFSSDDSNSVRRRA
jgi:hypothetical protein